MVATNVETSAPVHRRAAASNLAARSIWSPSTLAKEALSNGMAPAAANDLPKTHALCEEIMKAQLAPLWALASAHAHTSGAAWVYRRSDAHGVADPLGASGVLLLLPLNWEGEAALRTGRFNALAPRIDHLCAPGDEIAAVYIWLTAGADQRSRINLMRTLLVWLQGSCAALRFYARAASLDGARSLAGLGFSRLDSITSTLFFRDKTH